MPKQVLVRYKVKSDRVFEHERLIRDVFAELAKTAPAGIRYGAYKEGDGVTFVHIAFLSTDANPLDAIAAFATFTERIKERCEEPPRVVELTQVGAFGL